jgi:FtsH-binding integral membrane protein
MPSVAPAPRDSQKPPEAGRDGASLVARLGTAFGASAFGALVATVPAAIRAVGAGHPDSSPLDVWMALGGLAVGPMLVAIVLLRGARGGLAAFGGPEASMRLAAVVVWAALEFGALVGLGALLRATTHHHALAGVTFAAGALAAATALGLIVRRLAAIASAPHARRPVLAAVAVTLAVFVALGVRELGARHDPSSASGGAVVVDLLAFGIVATLASRPEVVRRRLLSIVGPPIAATLLVLGLSTVRSSPSVVEAVRAEAPLYAVVIDECSSWCGPPHADVPSH